MRALLSEFFAPGVTLALLAAFIWFLYTSTSEQIATLANRVDELEGKLRAATQTLDAAFAARVDNLQGELRASSETLDAASATLSTRVDGIYSAVATLSASVDQRLATRIDRLTDQQVEFAGALARHTEQINALTAATNAQNRQDRSDLRPLDGFYASSPVSLALAQERATQRAADRLNVPRGIRRRMVIPGVRRP